MSGSTTPVTFSYDGKIDTYTVPTTGLYYITAFGAQGGAGEGGAVSSGGLGAEIGGEVTLTAGEALTVAVGGQGQSSLSGGGGGGSFVVDASTPLRVAGGCFLTAGGNGVAHRAG